MAEGIQFVCAEVRLGYRNNVSSFRRFILERSIKNVVEIEGAYEVKGRFFFFLIGDNRERMIQ